MTIVIDTGEGWPDVDPDEIIIRKSLRNVDEDEVTENMIIALAEIKSRFTEDDLPDTWSTSQESLFKLAWFGLSYSKLLPAIRTHNDYKSGDELEDSIQDEATRMETRAMKLLESIPGFTGSGGSSFATIDPDPALM